MFWALVVALVLVLGPVMGLSVSWPTHAAPAPGALVVRVLSCNVDGSNGDSIALFKLIEQSHADVVVLQESPASDALSAVMSQLGWHVRSDGGLFLASQFPIVSADGIPSEERWRAIAVSYELQTPAGPLQFVNVHLETPRGGLEGVRYHDPRMAAEMDENIARRWRESRAVAARAAHLEQSLEPRLLIAGDFNLPVESAIYRASWSKYTDAWSAVGNGYGYTKFTRFWGARIDHILAGPGWRVRDCTVGPDIHSDHRPVIATFEWAPSR
jgi:endonuclease/exonuclease/phosphatase (EEP) superfamily protein YafD